MKLPKQLIFFCILLFPGFVYSKTTTPELYGARGDGITDDTKSVTEALLNGDIIKLSRCYRVSDICIPKGKKVIGNGTTTLIYTAIDIYDNCQIKDVVFDGEWATRGVQVCGSNVRIERCSFLRTKGLSNYFGGLTAAIRVGKYQNLNDKTIKYHNVLIKQCIFNGCEPLDTRSNLSKNSTVARFVISYGCESLMIVSCIFKGLRGVYDSDAIHLCSYEVEENNFPFTMPKNDANLHNNIFRGFSYAPCKTIIQRCFFEQNDSKSSIKIMSSDVDVKRNRFLFINEDSSHRSYSVVRSHYAKDISIQKNSFIIKGKAIDNIIKVGNSQDVEVKRNSISTECAGSTLLVACDVSYSSNCFISRNKMIFTSIESLMSCEYNNLFSFNSNSIKIRGLDSHTFTLFRQLGNHYSFPSNNYIPGVIMKNHFYFYNWYGDFVDISNIYDYSTVSRDNVFIIGGSSRKLRIVE